MSDGTPTKAEFVTAMSSMPWWLVLVWGILAFLIGIMLAGSPIVTSFYLILFMGAYWFVGGIFTLVSLLSDRTNMGWKIFLGIISILGGAAIMIYPIYSSLLVLTMMVIVVGFLGLLIGATKLFEAVKFHDAGAGILGILSIIFGIIILIYPYAAAYSLPLILGCVVIIAGLCAIILSFQIKKAKAVSAA